MPSASQASISIASDDLRPTDPPHPPPTDRRPSRRPGWEAGLPGCAQCGVRRRKARDSTKRLKRDAHRMVG
eukprot:1870229-Pleurochrysis_carterae.AAC.4